MAIKPIKILELHYTMTQFLMILYIYIIILLPSVKLNQTVAVTRGAIFAFLFFLEAKMSHSTKYYW